MELTEGALFAGIMGFGEGFRRAGFKNLWAVEKEPFCQAIIRSRFPETELLTDVRDCGKHNLRAVDVLTAGFPCQDLSVAGKRAGLAGSRSGLFWEVVRILGELRPPWFVLENVPGLFSSNNGEDFRIVLESLDDLGYGLAWRVLDSQFFGVAQRRRRVFIVGCFGKPRPQEVLFESEGSEGDIAQGGETGTGVAAPLTASIGASGRPAGRRCEDDFNLAVSYALRNDPGGIGQGHNTTFAIAENQRGEVRTSRISPQLSCSGGKPGSGYSAVATALSSSAGHHGHSSPRGDGSDNLIYTPDVHNALGARDSKGPRCDVEQPGFIAIRRAQTSSNGWGISTDGITHTLDGTGADAVATLNSGGNNGGFRTEPGEHLVSAPPDSHRVRTFAGLPEGLDSARYRALGNAVTASVAEWLARRIRQVIEQQK